MSTPSSTSLCSPAWRLRLTEVSGGLLLDRCGTPELVAWAVEALEQGADTPGLRCLAARAVQEPLSESLPWFHRSLAELGLELGSPEQRRDRYLSLLAWRVVQQTLDPQEGLRQILAVDASQSRRHPLLVPLGDLQAAVELQQDGLETYSWLYAEFAEMPLEELIRTECRLYLELLPIAPANLLETAWCLTCGQRSIPFERARPLHFGQRLWLWLSRNRPEILKHCSDCASTELLPLSRLAGRQRFLASPRGNVSP